MMSRRFHSIENLIDTLVIDGITVYVLDIEDLLHEKQRLVIYKLTKNEMFKKLKDEINRRIEEKILEEVRKFYR